MWPGKGPGIPGFVVAAHRAVGATLVYQGKHTEALPHLERALEVAEKLSLPELFVQSLIMGRAMAEGGLLMAEGSFTPLDLFGAFTPRRGLGPANLTVLAFTQAMFTRDLRGMPFTECESDHRTVGSTDDGAQPRNLQV